MPYVQNHLRLVAQGTLGTAEIFSFGLHLIATPVAAAPTEVPDEVVDAFATFFDSGLMGSNAKLTTLKLNEIGTDGRYVGESTVLYDYPAPGVGSNSAYKYPLQVSLAVGLTTSRSRGRASKGRFYLPSPVQPLENENGYISATSAQGVMTATKTLLLALNDALDPWQVGLVSNLGGGNQATVTGVRVGRVLDTIRSRRNKLEENYVATSL